MLLFLCTIEDDNIRRKLESLYMKYKEDMFKVAYGVLNDYQLAQDAVQMAFINIMNNLNKIDEMNFNRTRAFVVIIVRNVSINLYRKRKKQNDIMLDDVEGILPNNNIDIDVDERLINGEMFNHISGKVKELHTSYSDIISLKYFYNYSIEEIAKLLNITPENARTRLHRARQSLKKLLSQDEELTK